MSIQFTSAGNKYCWVDRTPFEINAPITLSCWVNIQAHIAAGICTMGNNSGLHFYQWADGTVQFSIREKTPIRWQTCTSLGALNTNQWYHFLGYGTVNEVHFFIDGVEQNAVAPGGYGGDINYPDAVEFEIGRYATAEIDAKVEEFAFWNVALSAAEILLLAKSFKKRMPLQIQTSNLMLYLPFDDANIGITFPEAKDLSGNDRHATPANDPTGAEGILSYPSQIIVV